MKEIKTLDELKTLKRKNQVKFLIAVITTAVVMTVTFIVAMMVGNYHATVSEVFNALLGKGSKGVVYMIRDVRLPRILSAAFVGAALSISGLTMQSLFKNPMASPSILGISSGAAFGASIAISFGVGQAIFGSYATSAMACI